MNGAEALLQTLINAGVEVCFANPGTSEMQLVAAIDRIPGMRPVLALFEGVATGAADGYGRMAGKPAVTLLHLGPGLSNGMANLHNARRARSPIVNIIGDHASYHLELDAPLTSDLAGHARLQAHWLRTVRSSASIGSDGAEAVQAAMAGAGQVASLIVPANRAWDAGGVPAEARPVPAREKVSGETVEAAAQALTAGEPAALLLGGDALTERGLVAAGRIATATGASLLQETFPRRIQRGAGRVTPQRVPYLGERAAELLKDYNHFVLAAARPPVSFFAYPEKPGWLCPEDASLTTLAFVDQDVEAALEALAERLGAGDADIPVQSPLKPDLAAGPLTPAAIAASLTTLMPEDAIVSDEANSSGAPIYTLTAGAEPHDWLTLTGGAIGQGLPVAVGAAVACPGRKVISLEADGSGMYTIQSLWTMARENLDITTVIFNNSSYAILNFELSRLGVEKPGQKALSMLDLSNPDLNWVQISQGMGVEATRATTAEAFHEQLAAALSQKGPRLIEARL